MKFSSPSGGLVQSGLQDERWFRLTVAGLVSRTQQFSVQNLQDYFSARTFPAPGVRDISCAGGQETWTGCTLNELLDFVGVSAQAKQVELVGHREYSDSADMDTDSISIPIEDFENTEIGLAWARGGEPLAADNGGPLLALLPSQGGVEVIYGLARINLIIIPGF
jgi:DMSO/TMAO reductase YedYZ molybdopterin-dependent catalytic subunit